MASAIRVAEFIEAETKLPGGPIEAPEAPSIRFLVRQFRGISRGPLLATRSRSNFFCREMPLSFHVAQNSRAAGKSRLAINKMRLAAAYDSNWSSSTRYFLRAAGPKPDATL